jgi:hypothetical protein
VLTAQQVRAIESADLVALGTAGINALGTTQLQALSTAQIDALTSDQILALDSTDIRALSTSQFAGFASSADMAAFSTDQIQAFMTQQLAALTTAQIQWLETSDIVALTTSQVLGFTTAQIVAFTTDQIDAFQTDDLKALTATQAASFTSTQLNAMDTAQIDALVNASPIVLDLDGGGVGTLASAEGVQFDLLGDGQVRQVGWVAGGDALLALDRNGDGIINDGRELFGSGTRLADGQRAADGYQALYELDGNRDGRIDARDERFKDLLLWGDADRDGHTDAGELRGLVESGVVELNLEAARSIRMDNGNLVGLISDYTTAEGQTREMADVWFAKSRVDDTPVPEVGDLLAPAVDPLPAVATPPGPAGSSGSASSEAAAPLARGLTPSTAEEELRQSGPLI